VAEQSTHDLTFGGSNPGTERNSRNSLALILSIYTWIFKFSHMFHYLLSPCANGVIRTLERRIMSCVFYHCATESQQDFINYFLGRVSDIWRSFVAQALFKHIGTNLIKLFIHVIYVYL
jgi:hypothetical protein